MSKNFNNNSIVDSTLNLNVQNLTNTVSLLPTQSNVNTTVTNAIVANNLLYPLKTDVVASINTNNLLYTTTVGINTLLTNTVNSQVTLRDTAINNAIVANNLLYPLKTDVVASINTNNLAYTTTVGINTLLTNTVNSQTTLRDTAITNSIVANNLLYTNTTNLQLLYPLKTDITTVLANYALTTALTSAINVNNNTINTNIINNTNSNNTANLALIKTFTAKQIFLDLDCNGVMTMPTNHVLSYTVLPGFSSAKQVGFTMNQTAIKTFTTFDVILNVISYTLNAGIYLINYTISINTNLTVANTIWISYGLGAIGDINTQNNKCLCSAKSGTGTNHGLSNSFCITVQNNTVLYLNTIIYAYDNPNLVITNYSCIATMSYTRIA